ncbi:MAG: hypothetical protein GWO24_28035, partial [Akkermansiaceae bacterium]|nr:hypothetical protein [Akkermansiaceae bacterium]
AVTERGRVVSVTHQGGLSVEALNALILLIESEYDIDIPLSANHPVDAYRVDYETLDTQLGPTTASGVIFVPREQSEPADLLSYQHGT